MSQVDIPQPWVVLMERRGIRPSYRGLGEAASIPHETVRRVVRGAPVRQENLDAVAKALGVDPERVRELRGETAGPEPWYPPESSSWLTPEERDVLARLIATMTKGRDGDGRDAAPTKRVARARPIGQKARDRAR